jgi:hypothetical protein
MFNVSGIYCECNRGPAPTGSRSFEIGVTFADDERLFALLASGLDCWQDNGVKYTLVPAGRSRGAKLRNSSNSYRAAPRDRLQACDALY